jgi:hypothetical protein
MVTVKEINSSGSERAAGPGFSSKAWVSVGTSGAASSSRADSLSGDDGLP